jgi:hypothetical protein
MKKCRIGRYLHAVWLFCLVICLFVSSAAAQGSEGLCPMLSGWLDRINNGEAVNINLTAGINTLVPYGNDTVTALNKILSEFGLFVAYQQNGQEETTNTQLLAGGDPVLSFTEKTGDQCLAVTSLLPDMTLADKNASPLDLLLSEE